MTHDEVEQLLGVYALHATGDEERVAVDAHLAECPRCRAEVAAHEEAAAMLGNSASEPPPGLWDRIAASLADSPRPGMGPQPAPLLPVPEQLGGPVPEQPGKVRLPGRPARRRAPYTWGLVAAAAAALAVFLGVQVAQLRSEVSQVKAAMAEQGLSLIAAQAEVGPHSTVSLTGAGHGPVATVVVAKGSHNAFWVGSTLAELPASRTYQLWGLVRGEPVSLAVMGPDPHAVSAFRLEAEVTKVMVTAEPEGGTSLPTTSVLAVGNVRAGTVR